MNFFKSSFTSLFTFPCVAPDSYRDLYCNFPTAIGTAQHSTILPNSDLKVQVSDTTGVD
jgi:hypothetical protein